MFAPRTASIMSPIQNLPVELLSLIFAHTIYDNKRSDQRLYYLRPYDLSRSSMYYSFYPTPLPFLLSHVCAAWRSVGLSSPRLWALIELPPNCRNVAYARFAAFLRLWIKRSGALPLSVFAFSMSGGESDSRQYLAKFLIEDLGRLESVVLTLWRTPVPFTEMYSVAPEAPMLRVLKLEAKGTSTRSLKFPFSTCPALRELGWPTPYSLFTHGAGIPFDQLTYLKLDSVSTRLMTLFISKCPRLTEIHFDITGSSFSPSPHRIVHDRLRTMVLVVEKNCRIDDAISSILLPNLNLLHIEETSSYGVCPSARLPVISARNLSDMLTLSGCQLDRLNMTFLDYSSEELQCILQTPSCSSLTSLEAVARLYRMDIMLADDILTMLAFSDAFQEDRRTLCPGLETMVLMNYGPRTPGALGRMIVSRFKCGCLKCFEFYPVGGHTRDWQILASASEGYVVKGRYCTLGDAP